ncbi:hypothetical protein FNU76_12010 [Chitinimonas arctica]|uniref:Uncharacterized protein n=1 Tax=Chitinimonas arctica TaxID=2594795 RepID=A0A516SFT7_9NEIS|nr:hypothetical protein [Chitinimonas arctica]QDQ27026.1 hypothetical protein FNU76_12010 [Chitinimonas arctica]
MPAPLQAWHEWLAWFSPKLAPQLGGLLQKLSPLMGPYKANARGGEPEHDGLGDLHRRGPYDRLLPSEWLLAEEIPEEFLRRAVVGEHLFLAPRPRAQAGNPFILALFDAGPLQLGAPRLAHIAMWILLARRAREAGTEMRWGILQRPPGAQAALPANVQTVGELHALLKARTYNVVQPEHWQAWQDALAGWDEMPGECWLIGSMPGDAPLRGSTHRLKISRGLDDHSLDLELTQPAGRRRLVLPLPAPSVAGRLVAGKFIDVAVPPPAAKHHATRLASTHAPTFVGLGQSVVVPMLEGSGAVLFPIPPQDAKKAGKPREISWAASATALALAGLGKRLGVLTSQQAQLRFLHMPGFADIERPPSDEFQAAPGRGFYLPAAYLRDSGVQRLYVLDNGGRLLFWQDTLPTQPTKDAPQHDQNVIALAQVQHDLLVYAKREASGLAIRYANLKGEAAGHHPIPHVETDHTVLFAGGKLWRAHQGAVALGNAKQGGVWRIYQFNGPGSTRAERDEIQIPPGWQGIGLYREAAHAKAGLVLLGPARNAVALYENGKAEALHMTASPIVRHSVCPITGHIALLTEDRELIVYAIASRQVRLHIYCKRNTDEA